MDETGISTTTNKPPKVFSITGKKQVGVISSAERGKLTTVICCCNASGSFIPPFFIFARQKMQPRLMDGAPPGSKGHCSSSGWTNGEIFLMWLQFFVENVRPTPDKKVVLVLDNHESHKYYPALKYAVENHIIFVSFAPHTTHKMQPLDKSVFGPIKKFFEQEINIFQKNYSGRIINQYDIVKIFSPAYLKGATPLNAVNGFKATGLWPLNPFIFGDEDYAPASVTDRPDPSMEPTTNLTVTESSTNITILEPIMNSINSESITNNTSLEPITNSTISESNNFIRLTSDTTEMESENTQSNNGPSTPKSLTKMYTMADKKVSPSEIRPIPKVDLAKISIRKRKGQRAEVLTSSPIKKLQYERMKTAEAKETKTLAKRPKRKAKNTAKQKLKQKQNKSDDGTCHICSEKYLKGPDGKPLEDWIMCCICEKWYHEECTSYLGRSQYICDFCEDNSD